RFPGVDGERGDCGSGRYFGDQQYFSGVVDQREFRRVDRGPGGRSGVGFAVGCARSLRKGGGGAGQRTGKCADERRAAGGGGIVGDGGGQRLVLVVRAGAQHGE